MKILVFDTETTWFINKKETDLSKQPYIVQFAGIIGELNKEGFTPEKEIDIMINPGIPIPYGASRVHNIYDIDVKDSPSIETKLKEIVEYINDVDVIIGHNIEYDESMIKLELRRQALLHMYKPKSVLCTMKSTVDFCAMKWKWERFKYPKLWELHKKLFGEYFLGAHDALTDVKATLRCFIELEKQGVMKMEKTEEKVMSLF